MDEIGKRLQDTTEQCLKAYTAWEGDKRNADRIGALADAVHEMRKVSSRLEIEMAASERDEMAQRPIPIPPHRASRIGGRGGETQDYMGNESDDDDSGNNGNNGNTMRSDNRGGGNAGRGGPGGGRRPMRPHHGGGGGPRRNRDE